MPSAKSYIIGPVSSRPKRKGCRFLRKRHPQMLRGCLLAHLPAHADDKAAIVLEPAIRRKYNLTLGTILVRDLCLKDSLGVQQVAALEAELNRVRQSIADRSFKETSALLPHGQVHAAVHNGDKILGPPV